MAWCAICRLQDTQDERLPYVSKAKPHSDRISTLDPIWTQMRTEAETAMGSEPALGSFVFATVLSHQRLEEAVCHRLAQRLNHTDVDAGLIAQTFQGVLDAEPELGDIFRADLAAVYDRDPACTRYLDPLLYFKGFHALVTHRFAHALWKRGRRDFALYLQSQSSRMFGVDIHPGAVFGKGIMIDHATGFVVGETATVGDNCSFLHAVTLGGSGKETGDRHPKIADNVLIGAGAKILGNIRVGSCSRIAAGSVVLSEVPKNVTVAGVPARIVGPAGCAEPARAMDQGWIDDFGGL
jgi:serine O-acetyltransferase